MWKPEPAPFLLRLVAFILGAYCLVAILTVTIMVPGFMVANWGGGLSQSIGVFEVLHGVGLAIAGIGTPFVVYSVAQRGWLIFAGIFAALGLMFLWGTFGGNGDRAAYALLLGIVGLHGMGLFWLCGMRIQRAAVEVLRPDRPTRY